MKKEANSVAITLSSFAKDNSSLLNLLYKKGFRVVKNTLGRRVNKQETLALCSSCIGILAGTEEYDSDLLEKLSFLKVISRCGSGIENIDLEATKRLGIEVFNTPDAPTLAVAELTIGLILNLLRKVNQMDAAIRGGEWKKLMGNQLYGKKVGIIGFGRIGRRVNQLLKPFNCKIAYTDPFVKNGLRGIKKLSKKALLRWADIISIHVSTKDRILGERELNLMKKGTYLINVSRGEVIDETALYKCLRNGYLSGAALDVFEQEPYNGKLKNIDNIILTPHIGSYAKEARMTMEREAVENLLNGLKEVNKKR